MDENDSQRDGKAPELGSAAPTPHVVALDAVPVTPGHEWPEGIDVANMITRAEHGTDVLLGACWMHPGQVANPWSFQEKDPEVPGLTHYGPTHEVYFVLDGRIRLTWDGGVVEAGPRDAVYLAPGWRYGLESIGDEQAFFLWAMSPPPV